MSAQTAYGMAATARPRAVLGGAEPSSLWRQASRPLLAAWEGVWSSQPSAKEVKIMAQKQCLVTGATGHTGGYTVERLLERGHAVRALAHREDDCSKRLEKMGA